MNESELRVRWEERLTTKNEKVLDELWQDLKDERYVDDALSEPGSNTGELDAATKNR